MQITRIYTGSDGDSHFEDVEISLTRVRDSAYEIVGYHSRGSEPIKATEVRFLETEGSYSGVFHNAPGRRLVITLTGVGEIEVGDGTKRRFGPGDIFLAEDTTGRGHISRGFARRSVHITLD